MMQYERRTLTEAINYLQTQTLEGHPIDPRITTMCIRYSTWYKTLPSDPQPGDGKWEAGVALCNEVEELIDTLTKEDIMPERMSEAEVDERMDTDPEGYRITTKENQMTKSRTVGHVAGVVVGTASEKMVRGGIATKAWWDTSGKAATITTCRTTGRGILGVLRAGKDIVAGAAEGARDSYNTNKATRK